MLLTGSPGGAYYAIARHLQQVVRAQGGALEVLPTRGAVESLYLLAWGHGDFAIVQGDVLESPRHRHARAAVEVVGPLISEELHVLVRQSGEVAELADLRGRKVATGPLGSGTAMTVADVLRVGGVEDVELVHLGLTPGLEALAAGQVDALLYVGATPLPALADRDGLAWISLREEVFERFPLENSPYLRTTQEAPYGWGAGEVETLGVQAYLVRRKEVDPRPLTRAVLAAADPESPHACPLLEGVVVDEEPPAPAELGALPPAPQRDVLRLLSGPAGGSYAACGEDLGQLSDRVRVIETEGSLRNLILVAAGEADLAIVQADVIEEGLLAESTRDHVGSLRLVLPLYEETLHVVARGDGELESVDQLVGLRVAIGETGSGTQVTARRLVRRLGWARGSLVTRAVGGDLAWEAVQRGQLDAAFYVGGQPITRFGEDAGFLAVEGAEGRIEPGSYPWLTRSVPAVSVQALLVARSDADPEVIREVVVAYFARREELLARNPRWEGIDLDKVRNYAGVLPLHAGLSQALESELR
ncbi:MAG: TAXI family TRAP transporter solute-binding subunit [Planctomycetota bacterium]